MKKKKILVVDDSSVMRGLLTNIINEDPGFEVVATAEDPLDARNKIKQLSPDIMTLDVEMPRMNGIEFLGLVMRLRPMPVIMVSSLTRQGAEKAMEALEIGAFDAIGKPDLGLPNALEEFAQQVIMALRAASLSQMPVAPAVKAAPVKMSENRGGQQLIAVGASTGGVEAIRYLLGNLPPNLPPIVITQHMPASFLVSFADRMDRMFPLKVRLAEQGMRLTRGTVTIAPGTAHLTVLRQGNDLLCDLVEGPKVSGHIPSVDVLFQSVADTRVEAVGVLLTGMGSDGAGGLLSMREAGQHTIGEAESSCIVYGMPRRAMEIGAVIQQLSLKEIPQQLTAICQGVMV